MCKNRKFACDNSCYRILLDNITAGIQIMKLLYNDKGEPNDYLFLDVNNIFLELTGLRKEDVIGRKAATVLPYIEPGWFIKYGEVVKTGKAIDFEMFSRFCNRWFNVLAVPLGEQDTIAILHTDITERKKVEGKLKKSEKTVLALISRLKNSNKNKINFISMLSHEIRNPLATLKGGIQLLEHINKNEKTLNTLKVLRKQTDYLTKLVDDLLDITRIEQNKIKLKKDKALLNTIVYENIVFMRQRFWEKGIILHESICAEPIVVNVDSLRITQCIGNVLDNASKFTQENGTVSVSLENKEGNAVITVKDNGLGISPEMLSMVFEPYKQDIKSFDNYNNCGLGLGLSLVKHIIEAHGGDVRINSPGLGKGTVFSMRLPMIKKQATARNK